MRLSDVYEYDPWTALQHKITESQLRGSWVGALLWQSRMGTDGHTRYGSYKPISNRTLAGRTYLIEWVDDNVAIFWLDEVHDAKTYRNVPIENL